MALQIQIKNSDGVILNYHHIMFVNVDFNQRILVAVESYIDAEGRQYDKDYADGKINGNPTFPYTKMEYITIEWKDVGDLLVGDLAKNMYEWLKTQPPYIGAIDV